MKVSLQTDDCIACGLCSTIAPDIFSIDTGAVSLKKDPATFTEEDKAKVREAASSCPSGVIRPSED